MLNACGAEGRSSPATLRRMLALFRLDFEDAGAMRTDLAGKTVYMALSMDENRQCAHESRRIFCSTCLSLRVREAARSVAAPSYWIRAKRAHCAPRSGARANHPRSSHRIRARAPRRAALHLARSIVGQQISVKAARASGRVSSPSTAANAPGAGR